MIDALKELAERLDGEDAELVKKAVYTLEKVELQDGLVRTLREHLAHAEARVKELTEEKPAKKGTKK